MDCYSLTQLISEDGSLNRQFALFCGQVRCWARGLWSLFRRWSWRRWFTATKLINLAALRPCRWGLQLGHSHLILHRRCTYQVQFSVHKPVFTVLNSFVITYHSLLTTISSPHTTGKPVRSKTQPPTFWHLLGNLSRFK